MDELVKLERKIQTIYDDSLLPLAGSLAFELPTSEKDATGLPSVLFLGNHSSGKSSFINYLVDTDLQKTGLAPTDDGFTIITFGEKPDEFDGQTVVTHPDLTYKHLQRLGPAFLSRLRLKTYPHPLLKSLILIDSPGMIDAAGTAKNRGYDFAGSVRHFAETSDLILFFFDPDKPGTTGETVSIFTETLAGLEYKLLLIMNKVDLFRNIRDFARTYGTLCWNLSKTIKTKDIPHIYNMYLPSSGEKPRGPDQHSIPLHDFEISRGEVIAEIKRTPTRRADNLVSDLHNNSRKLAVHTRVCLEISNDYRKLRAKFWGGIALILVISAATVYWTRGADSVATPLLVFFIGLTLAFLTGLGSRVALNRFKENASTLEGVEPFFQNAFRKELALQDRADLRAFWDAVRNQTTTAVAVLGPEKLVRFFSTRKSLRHLEELVEEDIPKLRREIAEYHTQQRKIGGLQEREGETSEKPISESWE
jgi:GTPase SAR1 family protein